jgi:hypothetical protein
MGARLADGKKTNTLVFTRNFAVAQGAMAKLKPAVAAGMVEAPIQNRATYSCAAVTMDRYDWPGAGELASTAAVAGGR